VSEQPNIVLVHGAWADGSSWSGVIRLLQKAGCNVTAPQFPYISGFALDAGESIGALLAQGAPTPALAHLRIDEQGFAWLPQDDFVQHFAADVDPIEANVMYAVQQPLPAAALEEVMGTPAWKNDVPTWYAVAQNDEVIPPDVERLFAKRMGATTSELVSGHVGMVSHPDEVAGLIQTAAQSVT